MLGVAHQQERYAAARWQFVLGEIARALTEARELRRLMHRRRLYRQNRTRLLAAKRDRYASLDADQLESVRERNRLRMRRAYGAAHG